MANAAQASFLRSPMTQGYGAAYSRDAGVTAANVRAIRWAEGSITH
jgi:hypothetical protein